MAAPVGPGAKSVAVAPPLPLGRKPAPTPVDDADDGRMTPVEAAPGGAPRVGPGSPASAAAPASANPREDIGPLVRSMVEQAMAPLDRALRSMVEQATAPLDHTLRAMVEQAMAPLDRTVRTTVEQAMAPLDRALRDLRCRLEEVERRPVTAAPVVTAAPAPGAAAPRAQPNHAAARLLDVAAIERTVTLGPADMQAFDGRRRRLRLVLVVVFACLVVFAGLCAALAQSYTHAHG